MAHSERRSPYQGLLPFDVGDRDYFFGRGEDCDRIAASLLTSPLTVFYAESGVGKTSALLAGAVPHLRAEWPEVATVVFRKWQDPESCLRELKTEVIAAVEAQAGRPLTTEDAPPGGWAAAPLDELLARAQAGTGGLIAVILDQFEDFFLYNPAAKGEHPFEAEFARSVNRRDVPAHFLLSLREDALAGLDRFRGRIPNLFNTTLRLEHLDERAAVAAIREPLPVYAKQHGERIEIDDDLVARLIADVPVDRAGPGTDGQGGPPRPGGGTAVATGRGKVRIETPHLQMVLLRLWKAEREAGSGRLRLQTYLDLGGKARIVGSYLQEVMDQLRATDPIGWEACGAFFDRLVTPSGNKIAYTVDELREYAGERADRVAGVLEALREARVLQRVAHPEIADVWRYEIAHDTLGPAILGWHQDYVSARKAEALRRERAAELGRAEAEAAAQRRRAEEQERIAQSLRRRARAISLLLLVAVGLAIFALSAMLRANKLAAEITGANQTLTAERDEKAKLATKLTGTNATLRTERDEKAKLAAKLTGANATLRTERDKKAKLAAALTESYDQQKTLLNEKEKALGVALKAEEAAKESAEKELAARKDAQVRRLVAEAAALAGGRVDVALLLSLVARQRRDDAETRGSLLAGLLSAPHIERYYCGHFDEITGVAYQPGGHALVSCGKGGELLLWDADDRGIRRTIDTARVAAAESDFAAVAFQPDGTRFATADRDGGVILWDVADKRPPRRLKVPEGLRAAYSLAFSPDGSRLAVGFDGGRVALWTMAEDPKPVGPPLKTGGDTRVWTLAFSRDSRTLATGDAVGRVALFDARTLRPTVLLAEGDGFRVWSVAFSPDGSRLAVGSEVKDILVWDLGRPTLPPERYEGHDGAVWAVEYSRTGRWLASGSKDNVVLVWDLQRRRPPLRLAGHHGEVWALAFDQSGTRLISGGNDRTMISWKDLEDPHPLGTEFARCPQNIVSLTSSPDGRWLVAGDYQGSLHVWDTSHRVAPVERPGNAGPIRTVAYDPEGRYVATGCDGTGVLLWDVRTWRVTRTLPTPGGVLKVLFLDGGRTLVAAGREGFIRLFDVASGTPKGTLTTQPRSVWSLAISPDGRTMASGDEGGRLLLWDVDLRGVDRWTSTPLEGHERAVLTLAFSPDGHRLASASYSNAIILWDVETRRPSGPPLLAHRDAVRSLAFSPDGALLASGGSDNCVWLWDVAAGRSLGLPFRGHRGAVWTVSFLAGPDADPLIPRVISSGDDGRVMIWEASYERWRDRARGIVQRNLTEPEFRQYVGQETVLPVFSDLPRIAIDANTATKLTPPSAPTAPQGQPRPTPSAPTDSHPS
jgi:WD40 repeat protein